VKVHPTPLAGLLRIEPAIFRDERGAFTESYRAERYREAGLRDAFVQDNVSWSKRGVLRGLHFQCAPYAQAKLVQVLRGEVFDAVVDLRAGSPSFGRWYGVRLSADDGQQLFVPAGFAHGFCTLSEDAIFSYKCSVAYVPDAEQSLLWSDPALAIEWPIAEPLVSPKDERGLRLEQIQPAWLTPYTA
jgi:dTDP-4-dehydrorhamnose 3,5-epimerase